MPILGRLLSAIFGSAGALTSISTVLDSIRAVTTFRNFGLARTSFSMPEAPGAYTPATSYRPGAGLCQRNLARSNVACWVWPGRRMIFSGGAGCAPLNMRRTSSHRRFLPPFLPISKKTGE